MKFPCNLDWLRVDEVNEFQWTQQMSHNDMMGRAHVPYENVKIGGQAQWFETREWESWKYVSSNSKIIDPNAGAAAADDDDDGYVVVG